MTAYRRLLVLCLLCGFAIGCENAEEKARYVKAPLETGDVTTRVALNQAVNEARTRLLSVRGDKLRAELSREIDQEYERASAAIRDAEQAAAEAARKEAEVARNREAEREQAAAAAALGAERGRRLRAAKTERHVDHETHADRAAERKQALKAYQERTKDAVTGLEVGVRDSALGDGSKVLILRNPAPYPVNFELRCYRSNGVNGKTFSVTMRAGGEQHIGFVQGWCGNFRAGEHCEAYVDGERLWEYAIPVPR